MSNYVATEYAEHIPQLRLSSIDKIKVKAALKVIKFFLLSKEKKILGRISDFVLDGLCKLHFSQTLHPRGEDNGVKFRLPMSRFELATFNEIFHQQCYRIPFPIDEINNIVDLGANVGLASLYFKLQCPGVKEIALVEANPNLIETIKKNLGQSEVKVKVINAVVSASNKKAIDFGILDNNRSSRIIGIEDAGEGQQKKTNGPVKIIAIRNYGLAELFHELNYDEISLLKMDIEGAEIELLDKELEVFKRVKYLCMEMHGGKRINQRMKDSLKSIGFEVFQDPESMSHPIVEQIFAYNKNFPRRSIN